jgi:hypothetical protein
MVLGLNVRIGVVVAWLVTILVVVMCLVIVVEMRVVAIVFIGYIRGNSIIRQKKEE